LGGFRNGLQNYRISTQKVRVKLNVCAGTGREIIPADWKARNKEEEGALNEKSTILPARLDTKIQVQYTRYL